MLKVNQIDIPDYQYYLNCNAQRMVRLTSIEKARISIGNIDFFAFSIFKKILLGQGVVQSEPNLVRRIPRVGGL